MSMTDEQPKRGGELSLRFEHGRPIGTFVADVLGVQVEVEALLAELLVGGPAARAQVYFRPPPSPLRDAARARAAKLIAPAELTEAELGELDAAVDLAWAQHCAAGAVEIHPQAAMNATMLLMAGTGVGSLPMLPAQAYVDRFVEPQDGASPFRTAVGAWLDRGAFAARRAIARWARPVSPGTEAALARYIDEEVAKWAPSGESTDLKRAIGVLTRIGVKREDAERWLGEDKWSPLKWRTAVGLAGMETGAWSRCAAVPKAVVGDKGVMGFIIDVQRRRTLDLPGLADGRIRTPQGKVVAELPDVAGADVALIRDGVWQLGRPTGQRLLRHLIHEAHDRHLAGQDDGVLRWPGGVSELLAELGISRNQIDELRAAVAAGPLTWLYSIDGTRTVGGLWTFDSRHRGPLSITVGEALRPGAALEARLRSPRAGRDLRNARVLIPELRGDVAAGALAPPDRGAAWRLHRLVMIALVDRARDLAQLGGAALDAEWWSVAAHQAGVPDGRLDALLGAWRDGEGAIEPMLELRDGLWTLADPHADARDFIEAWGRRQLAGARGGRVATRARAAKPQGKPAKRRG
jgi:hypothetical protein